MKKLFVFIIALAISLSINAQNYQKLWNEYDNNVDNLLPESAERVLNEIERQAAKDKNDVQLLKTVICRCDLFNMREENPKDTILAYCKSYLPKLSEPSQIILKLEIATLDYNYDDLINYKDNDYIKTVKIEKYAPVFKNKSERTIYNTEVEPTLYDYVMHRLIKHYRYYSVQKELYEKLLDFDLKNNYTKAYYNNRIEQLGYINNDETYDKYSALAEECTDNEFVAKIKIMQINYLTGLSESRRRAEKSYVKAKKLCDETMTLLDKSHPLYAQCLEYNKSITRKTITAEINDVIVPNKAIPVGIYYRNTTNPSYKIFKVSSKEFFDFNTLDNEDLFKQLFLKKAVVENTVIPAEEDDYEEHSTLIALPALQNGQYYLVFSSTNTFNNLKDLVFLPFQVSELSYFSMKTEENMNIFVVNRETGLPIANVKGVFSTRSYNYNIRKSERKEYKQSTSDKNGRIIIPLSLQSRLYLDLFTANDTLVSDDMSDFAQTNYGENSVVKTNIYTDRAIYRPGQTVFFRGIVTMKDSSGSSLLPDYSEVISLYDANYQIVDTVHIKTNDFGAFSGSFVLPDDLLNGEFQIKHDYDGTWFRVEEYKRPTFEVTFDTPEDEYRIGDTITITGKVAALSGFGLDNVQFKYSVTRQTMFPFRYWGWTPYPVDDVKILTSRDTTDIDGTFKITFQLKPSLDIPVTDMPLHTYRIEVEATSKQGETQRGTSSVYASYNKYNIKINDPKHETVRESIHTIDASDLNNLLITASNINGKSASTKVECKIFKIKDKDRYIKNFGDFDRQLLSDELLKAFFPNFDYYGDDKDDMELMYERTVDVNGQAKLLADNAKLKPAKYYIEIKSIDDTLSSFCNEYIVCDMKTKKMPYKTMLWTNIDKNTAKPGETINFYIGSSEYNVSALVVVKHGRRLIHTERITLNNSIYKYSYKVNEEDRGQLDFQVALEKYNTEKRSVKYVNVPYDNLDLDITLHTERDKLKPGDKETWKVTVKDYKNKPVLASMMAVMYDAALDNFASLSWYFNTKPGQKPCSLIFSDNTFRTHKKHLYYDIFHFYLDDYNLYSEIGLLPTDYRYMYYKYAVDGRTYAVEDASVMVNRAAVLESDVAAESLEQAAEPKENNESKDNPAPKVRKDFNETAFFYPDIRTDEKGNATFSFTMPDALTRWNLKMLAYSKDLRVGTLDKTFVTQQPFMIMADMPRFVYDEDTLWFAANVINLSDNDVMPTVKLEIFDDNEKPVDIILSESVIKTGAIQTGRSTCVKWKVALKKDINPLICRFSAYTDGFSDAEQHLLPVLNTEIFMTQTFSLTAKANTTQDYNFNINKEGERNYNITLNFSPNPMWYAIQALPYLAEGDERYVTTAFNRYFTNKMAQQIIDNNPKIKTLIANRDEGDTLSELQKYEELKAIMLKETPWVWEAKSEARQRANIIKLLDDEAINKNIASALAIMKKEQTVNGGWPWVKGMPESEYITQYILGGLGRLGMSGDITEKAFHFIENQIVEKYNKLDTPKKKKNAFCSFLTMEDLYAMSYFSYKTSKEFDEAKTFYIKKLFNEWKGYSQEEQSYIALILSRNGYDETARLIIKSLRERAIKNQLGMYWRNTGVESEARIIEAFNEIGSTTDEIDAMRLWILTQKRTNMWENSSSTVEAIFALMSRGSDWLETGTVTLNINGTTVDVGNTNYYTQKIENPLSSNSNATMPLSINNTTRHVVWGGLFRQYFVPIDKVQKHNDAMKIQRELFVERVIDNKKKFVPIDGEDIVVGDKIKVVITFEASQNMEFVFLKDLRGACFEPVEQISRYHYDSGLWYYQSTTDVSMEFFFNYLQKGKHTLSHTMYVTKPGSFSAGYSQIQCQYAPEFGAYSSGSRITIK